MTKTIGQLRKMTVRHADPIEYNFCLTDPSGVQLEPILVNQFLGKNLHLHFTGKINCIGCKRSIKKTYNQGYCFPCVQKLAACDMCILKPETCHFHKGTCREPEWGVANCSIPHIVYLANSSGLKVGITKENQLPIRWIDQGATQALPILRVQSRYQAGLIEVAIAQKIADKTDWRKMLTMHSDPVNLAAERDTLFMQLASKIQEISGNFKFGDIEMLTAEPKQEFNYPVVTYNPKISALSFEKTPQVSGVLQGIKGQYLMFTHGVINMRKYTGYEVEISA